MVYTKSEAIIYPSTYYYNYLSYYLPIIQSIADKYKLVRPILNSDIFNKNEK
jgi:hypothetical protein